MADTTSSTDVPSNVIVMTQFSRLRTEHSPRMSPANREFEFEALTALAEALDILGKTFAGYPAVALPDPKRLKRLSERAAVLTRELPVYLAARGAVSP